MSELLKQAEAERRVLICKHMLQLGRIWGRLNNPTSEETAAIDFAIEHLNRLSENKEK